MEAHRGRAVQQRLQHNDSPNQEDEMNIFLKVIKTVPVHVKRSDTIKNVKAILHDKQGISPYLQELFFAGERLQDGQKLVDCGIDKHSTLNVFVQNPEPLRIFVKTPSDQKETEFEVTACDTIWHMKSMIGKKKMLQPNQFNLFFIGKQLHNEMTLVDCGLHNESVVHMVLNPKEVLMIYVQMPAGEILKADVKALYTVGDVKTIFESMVGYSVENLSLYFEGRQLDESKILSLYNIKDGSVLEMSPRTFQVFIRNAGNCVTLNVSPRDQIKKVKEKIFNKVKIPVHLQFLVFEGKVLENDLYLAFYKVQKDSTLHLGLKDASKCDLF